MDYKELRKQFCNELNGCLIVKTLFLYVSVNKLRVHKLTVRNTVRLTA